MKTRDLAQNRWHGILVELGIDAQYLKNTHGPCPLCGGGKDRFRWDNKDGNGTYYCNGCGAGNGMKLAMTWTGLSFAECAARVDEICGHVEADPTQTTDDERAAKTLRRLKKIGAELQPVGDLDPVGRYLRHRGIKHLPKPYLRYHPAMPYYDGGFQGKHPAMVAAFRHPDSSIETFHVTYLTTDGHKANVRSPKKVAGARLGLSGCAIRLSDVFEHIGIAEGIETALSVSEMYGIPCWSCYSANGIEAFQPPEGVKAVTIFSDIDTNFTGQAAAMSCAKRLSRDGYRVNAHGFPEPGPDYNEMLREAAK